jgi:hypothetical protein
MFFFFLVGLIIYIAKCLSEKKANQSIRLLIFTGSGFFSGGLVGLVFHKFFFFTYQLPSIYYAVSCGFAGIVLYAAEKYHVFTRPGIQYISTILLGIIHACISYLLFLLYNITFRVKVVSHSKAEILFSFVLMGLITIFGYGFPERWFKRKM